MCVRACNRFENVERHRSQQNDSNEVSSRHLWGYACVVSGVVVYATLFVFGTQYRFFLIWTAAIGLPLVLRQPYGVAPVRFARSATRNACDRAQSAAPAFAASRRPAAHGPS